MNLALFDLDGTLLPIDSDHAFGQFLLGNVILIVNWNVVLNLMRIFAEGTVSVINVFALK